MQSDRAQFMGTSSRAGAPLKVAVTNVGSIVKSWQKHFLEDTSAKVNYWETDQ